jgi:hypothetical protein
MSALNRFLKDLNQNRSLQAGIQAVEKNRNFLPVGCESGRNSAAELNQHVNFFLSSRKPSEARLSGIQKRRCIWIPARHFVASGMTSGWLS